MQIQPNILGFFCQIRSWLAVTISSPKVSRQTKPIFDLFMQGSGQKWRVWRIWPQADILIPEHTEKNDAHKDALKEKKQIECVKTCLICTADVIKCKLFEVS